MLLRTFSMQVWLPLLQLFYFQGKNCCSVWQIFHTCISINTILQRFHGILVCIIWSLFPKLCNFINRATRLMNRVSRPNLVALKIGSLVYLLLRCNKFVGSQILQNFWLFWQIFSYFFQPMRRPHQIWSSTRVCSFKPLEFFMDFRDLGRTSKWTNRRDCNFL